MSMSVIALRNLLALIDQGCKDSDAGLCYLAGDEPEVLAAREVLGLEDRPIEINDEVILRDGFMGLAAGTKGKVTSKDQSGNVEVLFSVCTLRCSATKFKHV